MTQKHFSRRFAVLMIILTCPVNSPGQGDYMAANETGVYLEGPQDETGKKAILGNPAFQVVYKDVEITLTVDVEGLLKLNVPEDATIVPYCQLSDDNKGTGSDPKNFLSDVYVGKKVKWKGNSGNKGSVKIILIAINPTDLSLFEGGRILKRKHWKISGRIKNDINLKDKVSHYTIFFVIKKGGKSYGPYRLDPKLQANT